MRVVVMQTPGGTRARSRGSARTGGGKAATSAGPGTSPSTAPQPADAVYAQLREEIVAGDLLPQQRLVEVDICTRLRTSRGTVRAVLLRLEHDGLVVREPYRGAHVRAIDEEEAIQITEARAVLEGLAARQAAIVATDDDLARLRGIHAEMGPQVDRGDLWAYLDANRRLHACVIEACGHTTAQRLLSELHAQLVRFQYRTIFLVPGRAQQSLAEHTALVDAIVHRDPDGAEAAMTQHLGKVATTLHAAATRDVVTADGAG